MLWHGDAVEQRLPEEEQVSIDAFSECWSVINTKYNTA